MYPVTIGVSPQVSGRNRLTVGFRPILAIPHSILVGPVYWSDRSGGVGLLGAVAYVMAIINWFSLVITGRDIQGIRDFARYYLRWRTRAIAYMLLMVDPYPPFGDAPYPASIEVADPAGPRDRATIALRIILAVPHLLIVALLVLAVFFITVFAWFAILFTGRYPEGVVPFVLGVMRWGLRTEAYLLLLVDEYPPFTLE
jgi:hypothetical protein